MDPGRSRRVGPAEELEITKRSREWAERTHNGVTAGCGDDDPFAADSTRGGKKTVNLAIVRQRTGAYIREGL